MSAKSKKLLEPDVSPYSIEAGGIPWAEWSDVEANNEKWAAPKNGADGLFLDTQHVAMPSSIEVHQWIRARDLKDLSGPLTVYTARSDYPDLLTNNEHIMHSEFVRWYVSSLTSLQYCGRDGLEISGESSNFIWNYRHQRWEGWLHVYSMNKSGKGAVHKPMINPNGKYVVRLYFMGCWRRIVVDDMIPINHDGKPLLPRTANNFELWPILLAKGLLKLASLTWTSHFEIVDFYPIRSLTGWVCLRLNLINLTAQEKWDFLIKHAEHFEWPLNDGNKEVEEQNVKSTARRKNKKKENLDKIEILEKPRPTVLFVSLKDMREATPDLIPGLTPCWNHFIHIVQFRDVPLDPNSMKPPLVRWKLYRWVCWAIKHNLIDPLDYFVPIRCLKIVSALKECRNSPIYSYDDVNEEEIHHKKVTAPEKLPKNKHVESPKSAKKSSETTKEEPLPDIGFWADFHKMSPYLKECYLFYKLEYFNYTMQMSDTFLKKIKSEEVKPRSSSKETKRDSRKSSPSRVESIKEMNEFQHFYSWPEKMKISRNEPLYFVCDSLESKSFLINFSTMINSKHQHSTTNDTNVEYLIVNRSAKKNYLIIEKHNWFQKPSTPLISIHTAGTKSILLELGPGRHLLRIYCNAEKNCHVTISSDNIFHVGNRQKMHKLMSTESEAGNSISKHISDSIIKAFNSFGSESYAAALRIYYKSYMPRLENLVKNENKFFLKQIHEYFMEELITLLKEYIPDDEFYDVLQSLKVFFLDPSIGSEKLVAISWILKNLERTNASNAKLNFLIKDNFESTSDEHDEIVDYDRAATIIQSFFKMSLVKRYKQFHVPSNTEHKKIQESLQKISQLFDRGDSEQLSPYLLRNLMKRHEKLKNFYPCSSDFQHVLQIQECKGVLINVKPDQWLPIVRLIVNPNKHEVVNATMHLFVNLTHYTLRVFDNENGREMFRLINNVAPVTYKHEKAGYTIFGYGWSENLRLKELEWRMHIVTMKGEPKFHLLDSTILSDRTELPNLMIEELSNVYIPNVFNRISKWILRITTTSLLSLRLKVSYDLAQTRLRIFNDKGDTLSEIEGGSVVILPLVCLEYEEQWRQQSAVKKESAEAKSVEREKNEERLTSPEVGNVYFVEASVLNDSWPLTDAEWAVVSEAKAKELSQVVKTRISSVSRHKLSRSEIQRLKKASKHSLESVQLWESPYWILQVVTDSGNNLEIRQDRTRQKEVALLKESWAKDDPDRPRRGKELREAFLDEHALVITASLLSEPRVSMTSTGYPVVRSDAERRSENDDLSTGFRFPFLRQIGTRTLKAPKSFGNYLPALDLTIFMKKDEEEEDPWVKTECDEEMLRNRRAINIIDAQENYKAFVKETSDLLESQKKKYGRLLGNYFDNFRKRRARMEKAYEPRKFYSESAKSEKASVKGSLTKKSKKV